MPSNDSTNNNISNKATTNDWINNNIKDREAANESVIPTSLPTSTPSSSNIDTTLQLILAQMSDIKNQNTGAKENFKALSDQMKTETTNLRAVVKESNQNLKKEVLTVIEERVKEHREMTVLS